MSLKVPHDKVRTIEESADRNNGAYFVESPEPGWYLAMIVCDGVDPEAQGWEHISIQARSTSNGRKVRVPTWKEMSFVKDLFWAEDDVVMQLHPAKSNYINQHPHVLHLWRSLKEPIPTPPLVLV